MVVGGDGGGEGEGGGDVIVLDDVADVLLLLLTSSATSSGFRFSCSRVFEYDDGSLQGGQRSECSAGRSCYPGEYIFGKSVI